VLPIGHPVAFGLVSFVLIVVPGPNVLFVISRSLMPGRGTGGLVMIGLGAGLALTGRRN
jgi:threonine/homoserine/homoserine lactone efflux protein